MVALLVLSVGISALITNAREQQQAQAAAVKVEAWNKRLAEAKARSAEEARQSQAREAAQAVQAAEEELAAERKSMTGQGWEAYGSSRIYYTDPGGTCGYSGCISLQVVTLDPSGCRRGIYVAVKFLTDDVVVGKGSHITAPLDSEQSEAFQITDYVGQGEVYQITDMHCMGS
ncbi:hypothetical protein LVY72_22615 [Arthrobacter sp. I2-34]|uniref:Uncharacterized protein n=1 Tax=Arthrobacter hankyongi TaxID=2904801 RepID=A0ABS9LDB3_9MICC|nr:hypothetical protein [Arthrobacter hankyongi]MCG2624687.1 hypothetical protein [Arthrobacter hankyongi]